MPRLALHIRGVVQGVGFRPFIYREAHEHGLSGWVKNARDGAWVQVEGPRVRLIAFIRGLRANAPGPARIERVAMQRMPTTGAVGFQIVESDPLAPVVPCLPADLATCNACVEDIFDTDNRRHDYPFTTCAQCGPRYSLVTGLPYDRERTTMRGFPLCPECHQEYANPLDRRFHAEPIACPRCGPQLSLLGHAGETLGLAGVALDDAVTLLKSGKILALLGLGGFQLLVNALDSQAVGTLRRRKRREAKPLAVLFPDLATLLQHCTPSHAESSLLRSPEAPIVLVSWRTDSTIARNVAPNSTTLGAFLPYTPLHHLLLEKLGRPAVCTSGNYSGEPLCTSTSEALQQLSGIADAWLANDRPVARPVDDSVAQVIADTPRLIRRARGYAPRPVAQLESEFCVLALGAHLKSTISLLHHGELITSQHLGDLESPRARTLLEKSMRDLLRFFEATPRVVACDTHPDYASTRLGRHVAGELGAQLVRVQHHHAHVAACMAEFGIDGTALGLAWDGVGLGSDGTLWGGEGLRVSPRGFERVFCLAPFPLPGGERAAREPRRAALGLLYAWGGPEATVEARSLFEPRAYATLVKALQRAVNTPKTSSIGRLFDAVAALLGLEAHCSFEGQAAVHLEQLARCEQLALGTGDCYPLPVMHNHTDAPFAASLVADPGPLLAALLQDKRRGVRVERCASRFHNSLIDLGVRVARLVEEERVALTGGCFQNARLAEGLSAQLRRAGFQVLLPAKLPPGDGAISAGQAWVAAQEARDPTMA